MLKTLVAFAVGGIVGTAVVSAALLPRITVLRQENAEMRGRLGAMDETSEIVREIERLNGMLTYAPAHEAIAIRDRRNELTATLREMAEQAERNAVEAESAAN